MPTGLVFVDLKEKINKEGRKFSWIAKSLGVKNNTVTEWVNGRAFPQRAEHITFLLDNYGPLELMDTASNVKMRLEVQEDGRKAAGNDKKSNEVTRTD